MSRKKRRAAAARQADPVNEYAQSRALLESMAGVSALSGGASPFDGASSSSRRGWIYWPTLDTKKELSTYSRTELLRKKRWLMANFGFPNRIISGLSDLIGYLTPQWMNPDNAWNELVEAHWADRACMPGVIDAAGKFGIDSYQIEIDKAALGDGDVLPVFTESASGGLMLATYEAHQIKNPESTDTAWIDGVKISPLNRHLAYGVNDGERVTVINARDAGYHGYFDAMGRHRPPTVLKHAINNMLDISEILADTKLTIKVAAQLGLYLKETAGKSSNAGAQAMFSKLRDETAGTTTGQSGATEDVNVKVEDIWKASGGFANLPPGTDIGTIMDARPHPNQIGLLDYLARDISWGVGVAPEILWNIEKLKGANNRLINADFQRWISVRLLRKRAWMKRFCSLWVAAEIRAGRLPEPPNGTPYWQVTFIPQASITADKGREGQLNIDLVKNHMMSLAQYYAELGRDWRTELRQISAESKLMKDLNLAMAEVDRAASTMQPPPPDGDGNDPDTEDDDTRDQEQPL